MFGLTNGIGMEFNGIEWYYILWWNGNWMPFIPFHPILSFPSIRWYGIEPIFFIPSCKYPNNDLVELFHSYLIPLTIIYSYTALGIYLVGESVLFSFPLFTEFQYCFHLAQTFVTIRMKAYNKTLNDVINTFCIAYDGIHI